LTLPLVAGCWVLRGWAFVEGVVFGVAGVALVVLGVLVVPD